MSAKFPAFVAILLAAAATSAADGVYFFHGDWEVACDNTRTCRAAGYQADDEELAVSLLLTRAAGPDAPVTAQVMLGNYGDEPFADGAGTHVLTMRVDGVDAGTVAIDDGWTGTLAPTQVQAVLRNVVGSTRIEWVADDGRAWRLSDAGASAALLKVDDVQGRVGTPGAIVRKGTRAESSVLPPLPMPVVRAVRPVAARAGDGMSVRLAEEAMRAALRASVGEDDFCDDLFVGEPQPLTAHRLGDDKLLVSTRCWMAAYNTGDGYWVINEEAPFAPVLVTTIASDYGDGTISAGQKGRGLGDCWSSDEWTWDGTAFVHTAAASTGQCKLVTPGGAWSLPTLVTDVRPAGPG